MGPQGISMEEYDEDKDEEYDQRKRIWEVIKVLCKDPIGEISKTANKVRAYMTSDKVKSSRSRALSDPEKHAKVLMNKNQKPKIAKLRGSQSQENLQKEQAAN